MAASRPRRDRLAYTLTQPRINASISDLVLYLYYILASVFMLWRTTQVLSVGNHVPALFMPSVASFAFIDGYVVFLKAT